MDCFFGYFFLLSIGKSKLHLTTTAENYKTKGIDSVINPKTGPKDLESRFCLIKK